MRGRAHNLSLARVLADVGTLRLGGPQCHAGQALGSTGRKTATISSETGAPLTNFDNIMIEVETPKMTPTDSKFWYIEGRGQGAGTTTGWGEVDGFDVNQMVSKVSYAGVANLQGAQMTFSFTVNRDEGTSIKVEPPPGYLLTCSQQGAKSSPSLLEWSLRLIKIHRHTPETPVRAMMAPYCIFMLRSCGGE